MQARDRGQAAVELALCLPFVALLITGVIQVGVVVRDHLAVQAAAREAARAASVSAAPESAAAAAVAGFSSIGRIELDVQVGSDLVTATARYVDHTDVPLIGLLVPDVVIEASATMVFEPP